MRKTKKSADSVFATPPTCNTATKQWYREHWNIIRSYHENNLCFNTEGYNSSTATSRFIKRSAVALKKIYPRGIDVIDGLNSN